MRNRSSNRQSCSQPLPSTKSSYTSSSTQPLAGSTNSKYRGASQQQVPEESVSPPLVDRLGTCSITGKQSADSAADLFDSTFSHSQPSSHFQKDSNSCPEVISNDLPPHLLSESESDTETSSDENERSFEKLAAEYKIGNKEAFNERYEIVKNTPHEEWQLGDGQYSTVLLIMDKQVNEAKRTKPTNNTDPKVAELAKKSELYALKKVRKREVALCEVNTWRKIGAHRRIVQLYEVYSDDDDLLLVMELAGGGDLFDLMYFLSSQNPPKKLAMDQALFYLSEIVEALKHIHGLGIIYHDLKPENILLGLDGHGYLSDMGVADPVDEDGVSYLFSGTSEFMAPEMPGSLRRTLISFFGKEHLKTHGFPSHTKKVDIFSLGVLSIEMLTNRRIFRATKIDLEGNEVDKYEDEAKQADAIEHNIKTQVINKEVLKTMVKTHGLPDDEDLHEFLEKCLQHDVNERPTIEGVENLSWLSNYRARVTQGVKPPFRVSSLVKINSTVVTRIASKGKTGIKYTLNPA